MIYFLTTKFLVLIMKQYFEKEFNIVSIFFLKMCSFYGCPNNHIDKKSQ